MSNLSLFKISRRGRKLQVSDDQRTLIALPKEVPERTWAEILQKEENDLIVLDIREELVEAALDIGHIDYMERQTAVFTVHCAAEAWLKLINWHFYRHDPGEETSAYPPCYIPKREESWIPDERPDSSPKDTWCKHDLNVVEDTPDVFVTKWPSSSSLEFPVVEEIPSEYWFPGKINVPSFMRWPKRGRGDSIDDSGSRSTIEERYIESEVLQKVTDYSTEGLSGKQSSTSTFGDLKTTSPADDSAVQGSLHGAGDSTIVGKAAIKRRLTAVDKMKSFTKTGGKSRGTLPALHAGSSGSRISIISDCRLRNLRLETQYEITSEKVDSLTGETNKRK